MMATIGYYIFLICLGCSAVSRGLALGIQEGDATVAQSDMTKILATIDNDKKKDVFSKITTKLLQAWVDMYRHKNVTGEEEKEDDFFCVSDREGAENHGASINQVDIPGQLVKYMTKFIVKNSYTPFSYIKSTFETFGVIDPIGNEIQKKEFSVIDVDPLTMLFSNMQQVYNSYEIVEIEEESTKLLNMLARTSDDEKLMKSGLIDKLWPTTKPDDEDKKKKKCVLKKPEDIWDEIAPYDGYIIIRSLLAAFAWLFAFWVPIFPFIFSFPSRNGGGIFEFTSDGDDSRRDQDTFDYYDTNESQYTAYDNHLRQSSHVNNINDNGYQAHGEASHSSLADIVNDHISNSHKAAGTENVFMSNSESIDVQDVSSYTHYNANDIWYNHVSLR